MIQSAGISVNEIAAIGITNQRETSIVWDKLTGEPVMNAIVWQCCRTADMIRELSPYHEMIREKTGLIPDAYFSASKIKWILDNIPGARERAERGELLFGTVDTWLIWKLTGAHATDRTNASRTMLYNIDTLDWDDGLLKLFDIPRSMLPEVKYSSGFFGNAVIDGVEIPVCGAAGDQQAALFGQCCFNAGEAKNTYGTGCFLLSNTGEERPHSKNGLLTTICAGLSNEPVTYALEGSVFCGGSVIQWLRDELHLIDESRDVEYYASKADDTGGVYLVPAFTGMGAPYWDMYARGTITGITRGTKKEHIIRAAEESIAYQSADLIHAMERDTGKPVSELRVDGGATRDRFLMQFQADISGIRVLRPVIRESTALGAAFLAGIASGFWSGKDAVRRLYETECVFEPQADMEKRERLYSGWLRAVEKTIG